MYQWAIGVICTNAYIIYKRVCDRPSHMDKTKPAIEVKDRLSHLRFQIAIIQGLVFPKQKLSRRRGRLVLNNASIIANRRELRTKLAATTVTAVQSCSPPSSSIGVSTRSSARSPPALDTPTPKRQKLPEDNATYKLTKNNWIALDSIRLDGLFHPIIKVARDSKEQVAKTNRIRCQFCKLLWRLQHKHVVEALKYVKAHGKHYENDAKFQGEAGKILQLKVRRSQRIVKDLNDKRCTRVPKPPWNNAQVRCTRCCVNLCFSCYTPFHTFVDTS